jgi:hypothetical protein
MKYQPKSGPDNEALVKILADGQDQFQKWFAHKKITSILSDAELIAEYVADADVVFGAFHDDEYDRGWGSYMIKGKDTLMRAIEAGHPFRLKVGTVPCGCLEEAAAMSLMWGDDRLIN